MFHLLDLDENLLDLLLSFLDAPNLLRLCLTCHDVFPYACRHLFRHVALTRHRSSSGEPLIVGLNRFLDAHRECAAVCRTLKLTGRKPNPLYQDDKDDEVYPLERDTIIEEDQILIQPLDSKSDAEYIALISRLTGLRHLGLGIQFQGLAIRLDQSFHSLKHFEFLHDGDELGDDWERTDVSSITPDLFSSVFQLSAIETVDIDVTPTQHTPFQLDHLALAPTMSSLTLGYPSLLDGEEVAKLLANTPNLKKFHFEFYEDRERTRGLPRREYLSIDHISQALLHCSDALEDLKIIIYWGDGENPYGGAWSEEDRRINFGPEGTLSDLRQMTRLNRLEVPLAILLGLFPEEAVPLSENLPPNLRYLCISDDLAHWLPYEWTPKVLEKHLPQWIPELRKGAPLLEKFVLDVAEKDQWPDADYWTEGNPEFFRGLCSAVGIEGVIRLDFEPRVWDSDEDDTSSDVAEDSSEGEQ